MTRSVMTTYQKFREANRELILDQMRRMGVTCNRSTIFELILRDLWHVAVVKRSLQVCDSESWTSKQCSMSLPRSTLHLPSCSMNESE